MIKEFDVVNITIYLQKETIEDQSRIYGKVRYKIKN